MKISVAWTSSKPIRQVGWKMYFAITWKLSSLNIVSRTSFVKRRDNWQHWSFERRNSYSIKRVKWNSVFKKQELSTAVCFDYGQYKYLSVISNKIHYNVKEVWCNKNLSMKFSLVAYYRKTCKNKVQKQGVIMLFSQF